MSTKKPKPTLLPRQSTGPASVLEDQPRWVRAVVWVGVPTAVMAYLLWFVVGGLTSRLDHMTATHDQHQKDVAALVQHLQQETQQSWVQLGVMQRICLNTARTESDRMACVTSLGPGGSK